MIIVLQIVNRLERLSTSTIQYKTMKRGGTVDLLVSLWPMLT
jgi:hypothetical protein